MEDEYDPSSGSIRIFVEASRNGGAEDLRFHTSSGDFHCLYHSLPGAEGAALWVGGAGGGLDGPAHGMYPRLAGLLKRRGFASLRLDYRRPGELIACVMDVLAGVEFLARSGLERIALVGHSFGGAVVITAGSASEHVAGVAAMSSQTYGTSAVPLLSPRPVLFIHGTADTILPPSCSRDLYARAHEPKDLRLFPGCGHGLDECQDEVDAEVTGWLMRLLSPVATKPRR